jgi:hypothetical protein
LVWILPLQRAWFRVSREGVDVERRARVKASRRKPSRHTMEILDGDRGWATPPGGVALSRRRARRDRTRLRERWSPGCGPPPSRSSRAVMAMRQLTGRPGRGRTTRPTRRAARRSCGGNPRPVDRPRARCPRWVGRGSRPETHRLDQHEIVEAQGTAPTLLEPTDRGAQPYRRAPEPSHRFSEEATRCVTQVPHTAGRQRVLGHRLMPGWAVRIERSGRLSSRAMRGAREAT